MVVAMVEVMVEAVKASNGGGGNGGSNGGGGEGKQRWWTMVEKIVGL